MRWLILAVLTFARTAMGFQFQSVAAVSPFLLDRFHISYAALGSLIGLYLPVFAGYARDLTGNPAAPLWLAGAMLIVACVALRRFRSLQSS